MIENVKKYLLNKNLVIIILLIIMGFGINQYFNNNSKHEKKYELELKLREALTDTVRTIKNKEGYELNISSKHIEIKAKTEAGAFYAVQTLRQLLPPKKPIISNSYSTISIPAIEIKDAPVFSSAQDIAQYKTDLSTARKILQDVYELDAATVDNW